MKKHLFFSYGFCVLKFTYKYIHMYLILGPSKCFKCIMFWHPAPFKPIIKIAASLRVRDWFDYTLT